jgi:hypothetical protein
MRTGLQTLPPIYAQDEAKEAREDVALRLEKLARQVRAGTTTDIKALDAAYSEIIKLAGRIKGILG